MNKRYKKSIEDVRVYRGADMNTDHHLVISKVRLHLKTQDTKKEKRIHIDKEKMKDKKIISRIERDIKRTYDKKENHQDIEKDWNEFKETLQRTTEHLESTKKVESHILMTQEATDKATEREQLRSLILQRPSKTIKKKYKKLKDELDDMLKRETEEHWKKKAEELEQNMKNGRLDNVYKILNMSQNKSPEKIGNIKDKDGTLLNDKNEQLERWKEYFHKLLNVKNKITIKKEKEMTEEKSPPPSMTEIEDAIKHLKNGKALEMIRSLQK